jgi:hypothetical protein
MRTLKTRILFAPGLAYFTVALAAFVVFLPWAQVYFLGDDWMLLARNSGQALPPQLMAISDVSNSRWYRPLSELSLAWSWSLFGLNPVGYHVLNSALHALMAVLVAMLGQRLARDWRVGLWAGLFYAVQGCHTEAVVWITARHEMLAAAMALLGVISYIRFREKGGPAWWVGAFSFYIISLGFKETTLALPALLILYDLVFVSPNSCSSKRLDVSRFIPVLPLAAVGGAYLLFRLQVGGGYTVLFGPLIVLKNLIYYLLMETLALPASTHFLSRFPLATLPVVACLAVAGLVCGWLTRRQRVFNRVVWFGILWMGIALAPVILIVAERTTLFSSVGWAWTIAAIVVLAWDSVAPGRLMFERGLLVLAIAGLLGANLVALTHQSYWWSQAADVSRSLFYQVKTLLPELSSEKDSQLWFVNLPDQIEYAYAFGNRFGFAVWLLQGQLGTNVEVSQFQNVEIGGSPSVQMRRLFEQRTVNGPVVAFYWHEARLIRQSFPASILLPP